MTNKDLKHLPLPLENMDGDERSIMDGLYNDFQITMSNMSHAILADDAFENGKTYQHQINENAPVFCITVIRNPKWSYVRYNCERKTPGFPVTSIVVGICSERPEETLDVGGAPMDSLTAIAQRFIDLFHKVSGGENA